MTFLYGFVAYISCLVVRDRYIPMKVSAYLVYCVAASRYDYSRIALLHQSIGVREREGGRAVVNDLVIQKVLDRSLEELYSGEEHSVTYRSLGVWQAP